VRSDRDAVFDVGTATEDVDEGRDATHRTVAGGLAVELDRVLVGVGHASNLRQRGEWIERERCAAGAGQIQLDVALAPVFDQSDVGKGTHCHGCVAHVPIVLHTTSEQEGSSAAATLA